ncbi:MAG: 50S ribosomal protein L15e [Candidatus Micrarchaeota archaeon]|nr:50S ribosomal protein L15e [Candidatus Micrarchaeota archaeon]MDE1804905.1 50S ribosomal protein L15e [Candidatus Micrarchaeota archaeon]MDE1846581.1 50S ribosomal protein L15e [Candidatus Micrarchaeota archaeon]
MGAYKYIKQSMEQSYKERSTVLKNRISEWRREGAIVRAQVPTNVARARELGYKAKPGVIIVRVKVSKGLSKRQKPVRGRKPSKYGRFYAYAKSLQSRAEERAARKFDNCEVVNSYYVGEDGEYKFFETILVDRNNKIITSDPDYANLIANKSRAFRGLSSSGRRHRGIIRKGTGTSLSRPSVRAARRHIFRQ